MKNFGARLREERERLGLTQEEFAKACGVGRTAQFNYEREERSPSHAYLDAAEALGADSLYITTGTKRGDDWVYARAYKKMLYTIEMLLGLKEGQLEDIAKLAVENDQAMSRKESVDYDPYNRAVMAWLGTASKIERCLDIHVLTAAFAEVERRSSQLKVTLAPLKKSTAVGMVYRDLKETGRLDEEKVQQIVLLAGN